MFIERIYADLNLDKSVYTLTLHVLFSEGEEDLYAYKNTDL